jgi:hypothetical protein
MISDKVKVTYRVTDQFYNLLAAEAEKKGLSISAFTRYVMKKYINEKYGPKKTTTP